MAVSVKTSSSQTATLDTEHDLATVTDAGVYQLAVDVNAMIAADVLVLRIYGKARSSDTERIIYSASYGPLAPATKLIMSPPIVSPHHLRATLEQTDGTGRAYPWAIYSTGA